MSSQIPIFFSIDDSYAPFLGVALESLIKNASRDYQYKIYIMQHALKTIYKDKLLSLSREGFDIEFVEMAESMEGITNRSENRIRCEYFTITIFYRLFIAEMFPQYDKGIYIDSDILVPGDISELFNHELGDNLIGACPDRSIVDIPPFVAYIENVIGVPVESYINSGMLLLNLKEMRKARYLELFLSLLNTYHFDSVAPDQDYLNAMCHGRILYIEPEWDAMPNKDKPELERPRLIHYNLFDKPWCFSGVQYEKYYWDFVETSLFKDEVYAYRDSFTDEQRKKDLEILNGMLNKAIEIMDAEVTLRKVYESGVRVRA